MEVSRFAPSTTGPAHPGTLLAALLCWLDARRRGARLILRLEDLDPERCTAELADQMEDDLRWFGLDFDERQLQSDFRPRHDAALDALARARALYPCRCSRSQIRSVSRRAPDGGWVYPNTCRDRPLPAEGWRDIDEPLRARIGAGTISLTGEGGEDLSQDPTAAMGDPIVRRRDGAIGYNLAVVVDDAAASVTRVVRGYDIAPSTAVQVALQRLLGLPAPHYRHHLLLMETDGDKLAKLHGAVGAPELRAHYRAEELCGILAAACGLLPAPAPVTPAGLVDDFSWDRVHRHNRVMNWDGQVLAAGALLTT